GGLAEELPRRNVAPAVIPSSLPPFVVAVGVGGPVSNFDSDWDEAPPSVGGGVEGWRRTLWRCQLWWRPLWRRCLSLPWLSPWLMETVPLVALRMRLLVTMVAGLLSVLLGPSLARGGRARSVGSSATLLTRCRSSRSLSTPRRPP